MRTIRWLPAVALAAAACLSMPQAQAQTWLRWKKAAPVTDPATKIPMEAVYVAPAAAPAATPRAQPAAAVVPHGPSITISEAPPAPMPVARSASTKMSLPAVATSKAANAATAAPIAATPIAPTLAAPTLATPPPAQTLAASAPTAASAMPVTSAGATAVAATTPVQSAPIVPISAAATASPSVDPSLLPVATAATVLPASIDAGPVQAAPLAEAVPALCADCATADELKATVASPPPKRDTQPDGLEIQAEAKRRLLQGGR